MICVQQFSYIIKTAKISKCLQHKLNLQTVFDISALVLLILIWSEILFGCQIQYNEYNKEHIQQITIVQVNAYNSILL